MKTPAPTSTLGAGQTRQISPINSPKNGLEIAENFRAAAGCFHGHPSAHRKHPTCPWLREGYGRDFMSGVMNRIVLSLLVAAAFMPAAAHSRQPEQLQIKGELFTCMRCGAVSSQRTSDLCPNSGKDMGSIKVKGVSHAWRKMN